MARGKHRNTLVKHHARRQSTERGAVRTEQDDLMPPVRASPTSREWGDAGGPGHDEAMRDSWRMTGRCSMLRMLSP
eukprot:6548556-Prymnesium_polylepis.1